MSKIYAFGDVHGCSATLAKMLETLSPDKEDALYFLGDYIDRGPDSKGVVDTILRLRDEGYAVFTLRGNHEQLFLESDDGAGQKRLWENNGGDTTLSSFGISSYSELSPVYKRFFENTEHLFVLDDFVFVHAGLNFEIADPFTDRYAMLWIRKSKTDISKIGGRRVLHGHTPTALTTLLAQDWDGGRMNLDGGCVYNGVHGLGNLVAAELTQRKLFYEVCMD